RALRNRNNLIQAARLRGSRVAATEVAGPRCEAGTGIARQLTRTTRFHVQDPQLLRTTTHGCEDDVASIRRERGVLVLAVARQLANASVPEAEQNDLETAADARLESHRLVVRGPGRVAAVALVTELERSQLLGIRSIDAGGVHVRIPGAIGREGDTAAIGAEGRRSADP